MLAIIISEMLAIRISKPPIIIIIIIAAADHNHNHNNHHNPCGGQKGRTVSIYWINPNSINLPIPYRSLSKYTGGAKVIFNNT